MRAVSVSYAKAVGIRLRAARNEKHLSLEMVAALTEQEFRTSVLGAYERGDRAISLPRLQRLAALYGVPLQRFLPLDKSRGDEAVQLIPHRQRGTRASRAPRDAGVVDRKVTIDLLRLKSITGTERDVLEPYLAAIQAARRNFKGSIITIRAEDLRVLACLVGLAPEEMIRRLDDLDLCPRSTPHGVRVPRQAG